MGGQWGRHILVHPFGSMIVGAVYCVGNVLWVCEYVA